MEKVSNKGRQIVCSAFIEKDDKFLLMFCPKFKEWRVPGGRSEVDETIEETLVREMEEEIGVKIKDYIFLGYGQDNDYIYTREMNTSRLLMFFHAKIDEEVTLDPEEASEHKWLSWEELKAHENKEGALEDFLKKNSERPTQ